MAHLYLRLVLNNGSVIEAGSEWVDVHGRKQPAKIGAIFFQPESNRSYIDKDPENPEDEGEEITESIAPHYEVWAFPDRGSELDKNNETLCRRVPATSVLYAEEIWPLNLASRIVKSRIVEMSEMEQDEADAVEDTPAPTPAPAPAPVVAAPVQAAAVPAVQYAQQPMYAHATSPYPVNGGVYVSPDGQVMPPPGSESGT